MAQRRPAVLRRTGLNQSGAGRRRAGKLRLGPSTFDPARSGSCIERAVNTAMCDQLLDLDRRLNLVPQLATGWEGSADQLMLDLHAGVIFQDGTPFDAEAVCANIGRHRPAPCSARGAGLKPLAGRDAVNPLTVL